jgi:hypothetical protein
MKTIHLKAQIQTRQMYRSVFPQFFKAGLTCLFFPLGAWASSSAMTFNAAHPSVRAAAAVQNEVTRDWMRQPEVLGTAVALDGNGAIALAVYVDRDSPRTAQVVRDLPEQIRGIGVQIRLTDKFRAMRRHRHHHRHRRGSQANLAHKMPQALPIQLGTSGGWIKDKTGSFCCAGTLGALVQIGGQQYILSNWHVLEDDIVPGGNNAVATTGDGIIQPGLIDLNCVPDGAHRVATLEKRDSLPNSNVDCAIASVDPGTVRTDGAILEIGPISSQTAAAFINQPVKKSGRSTGLTHSVVIGVNATIRVDYQDECNGHFAFSKVFTGQIMVGSRRGNFLGDGDSGSLLVEDVTTNPRAIGLIFAGSNTDAIANPIDEVLAFLGATMVGN